MFNKSSYMNLKLTISFTILVFMAILFVSSNVTAQNNGKVVGKIIDGELGDGLYGVNVILDGTTIGAASDLDGKYIIEKVPVGKYSIKFSSIGFTTKIVTDVVVKEGETSNIEITLMPESIETDEVVITAKAVQDSEAGLLIKRQKSSSISDAISAEAISRAGSGNAADAASKITGASVIEGKYVYVRGMGDRYSSTQLNGAELPSADPDTKSFNLDLFPTNLLDNLVTIKSFTPDKPGSFSGGLVDVATKNYPEKFTFNFSASSSYNSNATFNDNFLVSKSSGTDWLGRDNGYRAIPSILSDPNTKLPSPNAARRDADLAKQLDEASNAFSSEMVPTAKEGPLNQSYAISVGDQLKLFGNPLGYSASLTYNRNYKFYNDGKVGRWQLSGDVDNADELNNYLLFNDSKGTDEVLWGGLANIAYKPFPEHDFTARYLLTQSGESTARYQNGSWNDQLGEGAVYETRSLLFTERKLQSLQFGGEHFFTKIMGINAKWSLSYSTTEQDEPDLRFFSSDYQIENGDTTFAINKNSYNEPTRFFRNLEENNFSGNFDFSVPFRQWNGLSSKFKLGGSYTDINRDFTERRFELRSSRSNYTGDIEDFFIDQTGIVDSSNGRYLFGNYIFDATTPRCNYTGEQLITAAYAMLEMPISKDLKLIGGARYETTEMSVISKDTSEAEGSLNNKDFLPSLGLVYQLTPDMNFRISYGKTLARPSFRELAPFRSFEFLGDFQFIGNPNLKRTLLDNFDLRWEWFNRPGELYAASIFYKKIKNPIERAFNPTTELVNYKNVDEGYIIGAEFEFRNRLDVIHSSLENFSVNANFSLIHSEVDIPSDELETLILPFDKNAKTARPLFGQSPFLMNLELSYINIESGTTASIFYNYFGRRLSEVTLGVTPDVYEQSRETIDLTLSQQIGLGFKLKFSAKNILDSKVKKSIEFKDKKFIYHEYSMGRNFSLGLSFSI